MSSCISCITTSRMNSDSSSVPTPPEGEWSDIDGAAPSGLPRVPLPTYPDQYSATSRRESLASSSSSIPTPPEGEWSDIDGATQLDLPRILPTYSGQYSATLQQESLATSSSSIPTPPEGEWSDANDSNALDPLRMPLPPYHGNPTGQYSAGSQPDTHVSTSSSIPTPPDGEWSDVNSATLLGPPRLPLQPYSNAGNQGITANSDLESSSSSSSDSQSLYEEPSLFPAKLNATNIDASSEKSQNDHDSGYFDGTRGSVPYFTYYTNLLRFIHLQKLILVIQHSGQKHMKKYNLLVLITLLIHSFWTFVSQLGFWVCSKAQKYTI